jgi:Immunity protein Imm1
MKRTINFGNLEGPDWPSIDQLKPLFFASGAQAWFRDGRNDTAAFVLEGIEGTGHLEFGNGRRDISLDLLGHPKYGVFLFYDKSGTVRYSSKGDMTQFKTYVRTQHEDLRTLAFFIPFDKAWLAVKEFIETEGKLPSSIEWVNMKGLVGDPFPVPHYVPAADEHIIEKS